VEFGPQIGGFATQDGAKFGGVAGSNTLDGRGSLISDPPFFVCWECSLPYLFSDRKIVTDLIGNVFEASYQKEKV